MRRKLETTKWMEHRRIKKSKGGGEGGGRSCVIGSPLGLMAKVQEENL